MINLIPPEAKERIRSEYRVRAAALWLFALSAAAVIFAVALLPAQVLIGTQSSSFSGPETESSNSVVEKVSATGILSSANEQARLVVENSSLQNFLPVTDMVFSAATTSEVVVTGYEFSRVEGNIAPVRVTGQAPTRTALAAFRDTLLSDSRVSQIDLPISNFAKNRDIEFSLLLTLASTTPGS